MIAARAQELTALIKRRAALRTHVNKLDAFLGREEKLALLVNALRPLAEAAEVLKRHGIAVIHGEERLPGLLSQLRRVQAVYREQPESFVDAQRSGFADFERTVNAFASWLDAQVRATWEVHAQARAQPLDPEVLRVLGSIPAYSSSVRRLQTLDQRVIELRGSLPGKEVYDEFERVTNERNGIWEEMQGKDFSKEVLDFLRKASAGGAALEDFTLGVENWITNHDLRGSFRITTATRASR
jgi:hypothetical protein